MNRVIIAGSPRANGRSGHLAEALFEACIEECPEDEIYLIPVSELEIGPCIGCNGCKRLTTIEVEGEDGAQTERECHRCVFDDDMRDVYDLLPDADELTVVSPVYFSGAPSSLKALLDRLQPFFYQWMDERKAGEGQLLAKRPATLHVVGEGGDANGFVPLVGEVRSALAVAGFQLERVLDWVGKIDADGEIQDEPDEYALPKLGVPLATLSGGKRVSSEIEDEDRSEQDVVSPDVVEDEKATKRSSAKQGPEKQEPVGKAAPARNRPKLDLRNGTKSAGSRKAESSTKPRPAQSANAAKTAKQSGQAKAQKSSRANAGSGKNAKSAGSRKQPARSGSAGASQSRRGGKGGKRRG